ncbi:MAG: response regulator, partial [Myxococcales bacterium]|nr:response regulator [Myxococcales bacterium]
VNLTAIGGGEVLAVIRDVRERREAEAQAAALRDRLQRGQRLESLGRLAGGVAHDFNNALTVISQGVELLSTCRDDERRELLAEIAFSVQGAAATAKQLLAFARAQPVDVGTCDARRLLERLSAPLSRLLPATIQVEIDTTDVPRVPIPTPALEQVILNLVMNARDAMPRGGKVKLACRTEGDQVVVEVSDDGAGMTSDIVEHVFDPFFTTKQDQGGSGLGLAMVWGIVTRYDGTVALDSSPGDGTRVTLTLPIAAEVAEGTASADEKDQPLVDAPMSVLVLEDQAEVRRMLSRILRREGYRVTAVEDAATARHQLENDDFSVLVTDGIVPGGGVPSVIEAFRRNRPAAPVVVCSGHLEEELVLAGIEARDYRFLRKPFTVEDLIEAIRAEL